jgi:hypothetical protein
MSRSELVRFCNEYLPRHPELKQRFDARDPNALAKGLAEVGADAGYDFSALEVVEAMKVEASAELSDGQLDAVAGGTKFQEITIKKHFDKSTPVLMSS